MECGCPTDRKIFIRVGKSSKLRNRLQVQTSGSRTVRPYEWVERLMSPPHDHLLWVAVWYEDKTRIGVAEAMLIDILQPTTNLRDRGYGNPSLWSYRPPDVECASLASVASQWRGKKDSDDDSPYIRNEPGIYAWYIDPGAGVEASLTCLGLRKHS